MAKVISFSNQKGGVGKTTSCVNISAQIAKKGKKVLMIDMDPQGNATSGLGIQKSKIKNTIYDVIIPDDAEVILCNEEKGVYRSNKIIVTNPRELTYEVIIDIYKKTTLNNRVLAQCLQVLLWKKRIEISKFIINDRVNKENVDEFIFEFEKYVKKSEIFCYDELSSESKLIYDLLLDVKNK